MSGKGCVRERREGSESDRVRGRSREGDDMRGSGVHECMAGAARLWCHALATSVAERTLVPTRRVAWYRASFTLIESTATLAAHICDLPNAAQSFREGENTSAERMTKSRVRYAWPREGQSCGIGSCV